MQKILNNHIIMSGIYKGISGMSLFLSIRLMIDYLGDENYGIWVLLFTLFQLVLLMDFGVQSTLKTKIPVYLHENKLKKVSNIINATYKISIIIAVLILTFFLIILKLINFKSVFNITNLNEWEVDVLLILNILFFCITFVFNIHKSLYVAFFKGKFSEQSIALNQLVYLISIGIFIYLIKNPITDFNKLLIFSIINGLISILVNLIYSIKIFREENIKLNFLKVKDNSVINEILKLGIKFMLLQVGFLFIFSSDSYIISNAFDPTEIVSYEVVNKLFQFPFMIIFAALSPLWSMFAKHYLEGNKSKLYNDFKKFNQFFVLIILGLIILYLITPTIVSIWLKEQIIIPQYLILLTTIVTALKIFVSFYTFFLSGIGKLTFYLTILIISVILKIPLSFYFVDLGFGVNSVLISSLIIVSAWTLLIPFKCYKIADSIKN
ncbi:MAG: hypothetical protein R2790_03340 [Flavobacterium haoranii]